MPPAPWAQTRSPLGALRRSPSQFIRTTERPKKLNAATVALIKTATQAAFGPPGTYKPYVRVEGIEYLSNVTKANFKELTGLNLRLAKRTPRKEK
ncbi:hypothetical protein NDU88_003839 [Pleurodeles waltl]|uniref:Uncharacterized protein n=1 Tax=Pleurodeles waltl TaxID=8319 RepID=A0AAV7V172_PLEWA|nr:hypothetical protein NDU88_003839 [Pleurodeles waltl]